MELQWRVWDSGVTEESLRAPHCPLAPVRGVLGWPPAPGARRLLGVAWGLRRALSGSVDVWQEAGACPGADTVQLPC